MFNQYFFKNTTSYNLINIGLYNTVYFINRINTENEFLKNNKEEINLLFKDKYLNFQTLSNSKLDETEISLILDFKFPLVKNNCDYQKDVINLFDFTQKSALLFINGNDYLLTEVKDFSFNFINDYITFLDNNQKEYLYAPNSLNELEDSGINISKETKEDVELIYKKIEKLKKTGLYLHILPIIEDFIKNEKSKTNKNSYLSPILIKSDLKIILTNFNELEVKLSTLTKCIYLLFLNNKQGIHLKELENYKTELIGYYKELSFRDDYEKMLTSINKIVDTSSNEIYVHLSRIKSFFYRRFDKQIADSYIVNGPKNKQKLVSLDSSLIIWQKKYEDLF